MSFSFDVRSVCSNSFLIVQISAKKVYFQFAECSLSYAKIVQMSAKKACF